MAAGAGPWRSRRAFYAGWRGGAFLLLITLAVYLPGLWSLPAIDRDEARFAQASRQMLGAPFPSGWVVPMIQDRPRLNKPPLVYWLQAGSAAVFTGRAFGVAPDDAVRADAIWMYRVPSVLAGLCAVLATWRLGRAMMDARAAWLGAAMLALAPVLVWESRQARADMVLLAFTILAVRGYWSLWRARDRAPTPRRTLLLTWAAIGAGVLTKGPITPLVVLSGALALCLVERRWRPLSCLRPLIGLGVVGAMVAPWVVLVAREVGLDAYASRVYDETIGRGLAPMEGHTGPPGFYLLTLLPILGAGTMLVVPAVARAARVGFVAERAEGSAWRRARSWLASARPARGPECFLLCLIVPTWIVLEIVRTKMVHYTMPLFPMLTLMCARAVLAADAGRLAIPRFVRGLAQLWIALPVLLVLVAGGAVGFAAWRATGGAAAVGVVCGSVSVVLALLVLVLMREWMAQGRWLAAQRLALLVAGALVAATVLALARIPDLHPSVRLARALERHDPGATRPLVALGYEEDSLIFETRGRARRVDRAGLAAAMEADARTIALVEEHRLEDARALTSLEIVRGINYTKGRLVSVHIMARRGEGGRSP